MWMGVDGCGCPSSTSTSHITFVSYALRKSAPSSASEADAATSLRMVQVIWIVPLMNIGSASCGILQRKKYTSLCLGGTEVGGIRVYVEDHVGSSTSDFCTRVHPHVVKVLVHTRKGFFSGALCCAAIADEDIRMVGLTACAWYKNHQQFLVCAFCQRHQGVDWCRLGLLLDCLYHRKLGSSCMENAGVLMVADGYIWWGSWLHRWAWQCSPNVWCSSTRDRFHSRDWQPNPQQFFMSQCVVQKRGVWDFHRQCIWLQSCWHKD